MSWSQSALFTASIHPEHAAIAPLMTTTVHQHSPGTRVIILSAHWTPTNLLIYNSITVSIIPAELCHLVLSTLYDQGGVNIIGHIVTKLVSVMSGAV